MIKHARTCKALWAASSASASSSSSTAARTAWRTARRSRRTCPGPRSAVAPVHSEICIHEPVLAARRKTSNNKKQTAHARALFASLRVGRARCFQGKWLRPPRSPAGFDGVGDFGGLGPKCMRQCWKSERSSWSHQMGLLHLEPGESNPCACL